MKFVEFFDRIYVVNLPHRVDRLRKMEQELAQAGMPFEAGKVEVFAAIKPDSPEPFTSIGYKGCFLSHLAILKQARELQLQNVLILEDDLKLLETFVNYEAQVVNQLQQTHWDIVYFGYGCPTPIVVPEALPSFQSCPREVFEMHMYAVNHHIFDRLINFLEAMLERPHGHILCGPIPYDGAINVFHWQNLDIARLITIPALGVQRGASSDINPRWLDRLPVLGSAVAIARDLGIAKNLKKLVSQ